MTIRQTTQAGRLSAVAAALCVVPLAAACSGSGSGAEGSGTGKPSGEIRVVSNWTGSEGEAFQAVIDGFKRSTRARASRSSRCRSTRPRRSSPSSSRPARRPTSRWRCPASSGSFADQGLLLNLDDAVGRLDRGRRVHRRPQADRHGPRRQGDARVLQGQRQRASIWYSPQQLEKLGIAEAQDLGRVHRGHGQGQGRRRGPPGRRGQGRLGRSPSGPTRSSCTSPAPRPSATWPRARSAGTTRGSSSRSRCSAT